MARVVRIRADRRPAALDRKLPGGEFEFVGRFRRADRRRVVALSSSSDEKSSASPSSSSSLTGSKSDADDKTAVTAQADTAHCSPAAPRPMIRVPAGRVPNTRVGHLRHPNRRPLRPRRDPRLSPPRSPLPRPPPLPRPRPRRAAPPIACRHRRPWYGAPAAAFVFAPAVTETVAAVADGPCGRANPVIPWGLRSSPGTSRFWVIRSRGTLGRCGPMTSCRWPIRSRIC